jgi:hypothetical protein
MKLRQRPSGRISPLARWHAVSDHLCDRGFRSAPRGQMEFVTNQLALVFHAPLGRPIHHAAGESKTISSAGTFDDFELELARTDGSHYARALLMEVQIGGSDGAVWKRIENGPIPSQVGCKTRHREQHQNESEKSSHFQRRLQQSNLAAKCFVRGNHSILLNDNFRKAGTFLGSNPGVPCRPPKKEVLCCGSGGFEP